MALPNSPARRTAFLALLLAMALVASQLELLIPSPVPGVKPGFANLFSLIALLVWGPSTALTMTVARVIFQGLLTGLGLFFACSAAGALAAQALTIGLFLLSRRTLSPVFLSIAGALAHNLAQLTVAGTAVGWPVVFGYGPSMLALGLAAGLAVGLVCLVLAPRVDALWRGEGR